MRTLHWGACAVLYAVQKKGRNVLPLIVSRERERERVSARVYNIDESKTLRRQCALYITPLELY